MLLTKGIRETRTIRSDIDRILWRKIGQRRASKILSATSGKRLWIDNATQLKQQQIINATTPAATDSAKNDDDDGSGDERRSFSFSLRSNDKVVAFLISVDFVNWSLIFESIRSVEWINLIDVVAAATSTAIDVWTGNRTTGSTVGGTLSTSIGLDLMRFNSRLKKRNKNFFGE